MSSSVVVAGVEAPGGVLSRRSKAKAAESPLQDPTEDSVAGRGDCKRAAFFDVDGTISKTNVVMAYYAARKEELPFWFRIFWFPLFLLTCVFYLIVDWFHRPTFNRIFYRSYGGRPANKKAELADLIYRKYYQPRIYTGAKELIQKLKSQGYMIVFVTGSLDFMIDPLAKELGADFVYAAEIIEEKGRLTGKLKGMAVSNDEKATRIKEYSLEHGISLSDCLAYGDSIADLAMLEAVGRPHVVNPDSRLRAIATNRGWPILQWVLSPRSDSSSKQLN